MKKALINLDLQFHTTEDFAKALHLMDVSLTNDVPLDDVACTYCFAVFSDVIDLLMYYEGVVNERLASIKIDNL